MFKVLGIIFLGKPNCPQTELPWLLNLLLEVRYLGYLFIITFFVIQPFVIAGYDTPSESMEPTIMTNTRYLALPSAYGGFVRFSRIKLPGYKKFKRGDIVIFKYPLDETQNYVKRLIGLPGDRVEIRDRTLFINGTAVEEPYVRYRPVSNTKSINYGPVTVPAKHLFVMGDNRDHSYDSRYWGFLPIENVYGTPLLTFWSYDLQKKAIRFQEIFKILK